MIEAILAKVHQALNRLGQSTDAASSSGSIHAKVTDVKNTLNTVNSNMATSSQVSSLATSTQATNIQSTANSINSNMATTTQATNIQNTVNSLATSTQATNIQNTVNGLPTSMIRSIQQITATASGTVTLPTALTNTSKAIAIPSGYAAIGGTGNTESLYATITNTTTVTITGTNFGGFTCAWYIIEFV